MKRQIKFQKFRYLLIQFERGINDFSEYRRQCKCKSYKYKFGPINGQVHRY